MNRNYIIIPFLIAFLFIIPKLSSAGQHELIRITDGDKIWIKYQENPEKIILHKNPRSYVLQKLKRHDIVFLGTTHRKQAILNFVSDLIPHLNEFGITHLGLEISSDQQDRIDNLLQTGTGLETIDIHSQIDSPEYRNILKTIWELDQRKRPAIIALDLPRSKYQGKINRDEWMARSITKIFKRDPNAKMLVVIGNLHVLKKIAWEEDVPNAHEFIRSYLNEISPHLRAFSIGQLIL